jgi:hypothetical protein
MFPDGPGVITSGPRITLAAADAAAMDQGDQVTRAADGKNYFLGAPEPDGQGMVGFSLSDEEG